MNKKMLKPFAGILAVLMLIVNLFTISVFADEPLDEIEKYEITINVRQDGTLDMRYYIQWKVLGDKNGTEPLEWVNIGIPNEHVDQIQGLTDNIANIAYSNSGGGDYVRIDFSDSYYEGEVIDFSFSIHQSYMYILDEENVCRYGFTPGWFDEIEVKDLHIYWKRDGVISSDANANTHKISQYLEWSRANMKAGDHFSINVRYDLSNFSTDENMQYTERSGSNISGKGLLILLGIFIFIVILMAVVYFVENGDDGYGGGSGFGGSGGVYVHHTSSCARSCACVSCACACACAGGGRAGCSAKNFYNVEKLEDVCKPWYKKIFKR